MHNFHGYNNARKRRCERRKELQAAYNVNTALKDVFNNTGNPKQEVITPARPVLSLNRKPMGRVEKAISVRSTPVHDSLDNTCLPQAALYSTKIRSRRRLESGSVTARV